MDKSSSTSRDPDALLALIAQMAGEMAEAQAEISQLKGAISVSDDARSAAEDEVKRLNGILNIFTRHCFGRRSEHLDPDQYQFILEEIEAARSGAEQDVESKERAEGPVPRARRRINRGRLSASLERIQQLVDIEDKTCTCCGGGLHVIGEDVSERLDVVPTQFACSSPAARATAAAAATKARLSRRRRRAGSSIAGFRLIGWSPSWSSAVTPIIFPFTDKPRSTAAKASISTALHSPTGSGAPAAG
jgi:hypothetical protein